MCGYHETNVYLLLVVMKGVLMMLEGEFKNHSWERAKKMMKDLRKRIKNDMEMTQFEEDCASAWGLFAA